MVILRPQISDSPKRLLTPIASLPIANNVFNSPE